MRNEIAEWILSQVASPEQARTIVGDLLEAQPGPVAFWGPVFRATGSIAMHQPGRFLSSFLWSASVAAVYGLWVWLITSNFLHALGLLRFFLAVPLAVFGLGWLIVVALARKAGTSSSLMCVAFTVWLMSHNGVLERLWVLPPFLALWLWWPKRNHHLPEGDRRVAE